MDASNTLQLAPHILGKAQATNVQTSLFRPVCCKAVLLPGLQGQKRKLLCAEDHPNAASFDKDELHTIASEALVSRQMLLMADQPSKIAHVMHITSSQACLAAHCMQVSWHWSHLLSMSEQSENDTSAQIFSVGLQQWSCE